MTNVEALRGARILFVLPTLGYAGSERQAFLLARHLRHIGAAVEFVSMTTIASMTEQCEREGIPYEFFEMTHSYRSRIGHVRDVLRFARFLRRKKVDILLPYCMFQNILCALTWRLGGAGACIWNQRDEGRSRMERWIERIAVRQVRRFISNSDHGALFLTDTLQVPAPRVHVVHNGLEPARADSGIDWRKRAGVPEGGFVASMVANLHRMKDHRTLITAWRTVVDSWRCQGAPHLLLAGAFHESHQALVEQVRASRLERHVHFLGEVSDVAGLYRASDLAVFSSFNEGVPNAVLEAMMHGLAVVATDSEGIREALGTECSTWLVRKQDPDELAATVLRAAACPELRADLGRRGRRRIEEEFSIHRMTDNMTNLIIDEWRSSHQ
jgi:glycosyltransferase involved in cell wall biosynthesis